MDYIACRRCDLKDNEDYKVVAGNEVAKQHKMVIFKMNLYGRIRENAREKARTSWWICKVYGP